MNRLFIIVLTLFLSLPAYVWAVDENFSSNQVEQPTVVNQLDEDIINTQRNQQKVPTSKKKLAKKFLAAMGGVAISSFSIFAMLSIYNRIRERWINPIKIADGEPSLKTAEDLDGAIKNFLDKTDWS